MFNLSYKIEDEKGVKTYTNVAPPEDFSFGETLEFIKKTLIKIAETALKEEQQKGFDKKPVQIVDGKRDKPLAQVKPFGSIMFVSRTDLKEIILNTYENIAKFSPVGDTGIYKKHNFVFFNGERIATSFSELKAWADVNRTYREKDRIRFVNVTPYAQRLELQGVMAGRQYKRIGKSKSTSMKAGTMVRRPNGAYYLAYKLAHKKYGKNVFIRYDPLPGNYLGITEPLPMPRPGRKAPFRDRFAPSSKYNSGFYIYHTIVMSLSLQGLNL